MTEREPMRRLSWEGCRNVRDLGGYRTADGHTTRWGAIVRSDELWPLTDAGRAALLAAGIRAIVDLRRPGEQARFPDPFATPGDHGIAYMRTPFQDPDVPPAVYFVTLSDSHTLADEYTEMLDAFAARVAAIMTAIARAPEGPILVHCAGGKDRTGLVCALLLDLVGVSRETIGADYALSAECVWPEDEEWLADGPGERAERERELERWAARAGVMIAVLERLDARYGGAAAYLTQSGVAPEDITRLRERLL